MSSASDRSRQHTRFSDGAASSSATSKPVDIPSSSRSTRAGTKRPLDTLVTPPDTDGSTPSNSFGDRPHAPSEQDPGQRDPSYPLSDISKRVIDQFCLRYQGEPLSRSDFKVTPKEFDEIQFYLYHNTRLAAFVEVNVRYDYSPTTGQLRILMPPGPLHQAVEEFMIDEVEEYLRKARRSKRTSVSKCAQRIKWLRDRPIRRFKDVDREDIDQMPPSHLPPTPERPRKSLRQARQTRKAREMAELTTSFGSNISASSDQSAEPHSIRIPTEQHFPDSSWAWRDLTTGNYLTRPVVLEIAYTQTLKKLEQETMHRIKKFPISSLIGIDIENDGAKFHGSKKLQKDATYALCWHTEAEENVRTGVVNHYLDTTMTYRVLDPQLDPCGPTRLDLVDFEDFVPSDQMDLLEDEAQKSKDKAYDVRDIQKYPPFSLDTHKLRKAIISGYEEINSLEVAAARMENTKSVQRGLRSVTRRRQKRRKRDKRNREGREDDQEL